MKSNKSVSSKSSSVKSVGRPKKRNYKANIARAAKAEKAASLTSSVEDENKIQISSKAASDKNRGGRLKRIGNVNIVQVAKPQASVSVPDDDDDDELNDEVIRRVLESDANFDDHIQSQERIIMQEAQPEQTVGNVVELYIIPDKAQRLKDELRLFILATIQGLKTNDDDDQEDRLHDDEREAMMRVLINSVPMDHEVDYTPYVSSYHHQPEKYFSELDFYIDYLNIQKNDGQILTASVDEYFELERRLQDVDAYDRRFQEIEDLVESVRDSVYLELCEDETPVGHPDMHDNSQLQRKGRMIRAQREMEEWDNFCRESLWTMKTANNAELIKIPSMSVEVVRALLGSEEDNTIIEMIEPNKRQDFNRQWEKEIEKIKEQFAKRKTSKVQIPNDVWEEDIQSQDRIVQQIEAAHIRRMQRAFDENMNKLEHLLIDVTEFRQPSTSSAETKEEISKRKRREYQRNYQRMRRSQMSEVEKAERRRKDRERHHVRRSSMSDEERVEVRKVHRATEKQRISQMSDEAYGEFRDKRNTQQAKRKSQLHDTLTDDQLLAIRHAQTDKMKEYRHQAKLAASAAMLAKYEAFIKPNETRQGPNDMPLYDLSFCERHYCGPMNAICKYCRAKHFEAERNTDGGFLLCCRKGKLRLPERERDENDPDYPSGIADMIRNESNPEHNHFMKYFRHYNAAFAMVSVGAQFNVPPGQGPFSFQISGFPHHYTPNVTFTDPTDNVTRRRYCQTYFYDANESAALRMTTDEGERQILRDKIINHIEEELRRVNPYAKALRHFYQQAAKQVDENPDDEHPLRNYSLQFNRNHLIEHIHEGRQNAPSDDRQICLLMITGDDGEDGIPNYYRDLRIRFRGENVNNSEQLHEESPFIMPLTYPLFFPRGDHGWFPQFQCQPYLEGAEDYHPTQLQWYQAMLHERPRRGFEPLFFGRELFQMFGVEAFGAIEKGRIKWLSHNQDKIKADYYASLNNHVREEAQRQGLTAIPAVILPSSHTGSARYMLQQEKDMVAMFAEVGMPNLFVTFTCRPGWPEVLENLKLGQHPWDRPDLVVRVFQIKLKALIKDIMDGLFGTCLAYGYTIEYQKRGNIHAHMVFTLTPKYSPTTPELIDRLISAEFPDNLENAELYEIIRTTMIHKCSPHHCRAKNPEECRYNFPKQFQDHTKIVPYKYAHYKRRFTGNMSEGFNNRNVASFNAYLSYRYNAHISVDEIANSKGCISYIFKYMFKNPFDCGMFRTLLGGRLVINELMDFETARVIGPHEAQHRILEFPVCGKSHTTIRLVVHEPIRTVDYVVEHGMDVDPENDDIILRSPLEGYFILNNHPTDINGTWHLTYVHLPKTYRWDAKLRRWVLRYQSKVIIARMYPISAYQVELFAIRTLLLNVPGIKGWEHMRTVNGILYPTFKEACQKLNLMRDDQVYIAVFDEMKNMNTPGAFRKLFCSTILMAVVTDSMVFWEKYKMDLIIDYRRKASNFNKTDDDLYNWVLTYFNKRFSYSGKTNFNFGLPMPEGVDVNNQQLMAIVMDDNDGRPLQGQLQIDRNIQLNQGQQNAFNQIMAAARDPTRKDRLFYVNGPGGSGKTTLYRQIYEACRIEKLGAKCYATTGIAATLMIGGQTAHRGFGLPIVLDSKSESYLQYKLWMPSVRELKAVSVILIDEITMISKHALRVIDSFLRALMGSDKEHLKKENFGGKVVVVGGDFRQLLPVVPGGSKEDIINECVISSPLWKNFKVLKLTHNMRAHNDEQYSSFLLKLGINSLPAVPEIKITNIFEIPPQIVLQIPAEMQKEDDEFKARNPIEHAKRIPVALKALIQEVFEQNLTPMDPNDRDAEAKRSLELAGRCILATTIKQMMFVNNHVINMVPGTEKIFNSIDSIKFDGKETEQCVRENEQMYTVEWLNNQTPSGMPPHRLRVKVGIIVMLLRNQDPVCGESNGTRMIVRSFTDNLIMCEIISEAARGRMVPVYRMDLVADDPIMPKKFQRTQFPLLPAYAMTVNKSQGQTIQRVGLYITSEFFSHGQAYVAFSRVKSSRDIIVHFADGQFQGNLMKNHRRVADRTRVFSPNMVYREIFRHGEMPDPNSLEQLDPDLAARITAELQAEALQEEEDLAADEVIRNINLHQFAYIDNQLYEEAIDRSLYDELLLYDELMEDVPGEDEDEYDDEEYIDNEEARGQFYDYEH